MKHIRGFFLLEVSCFGFLFLCSILPFLQVQKNIFQSIRLEELYTEKQIQERNAVLLLYEWYDLHQDEKIAYYHRIGIWSMEKEGAVWRAEIKKEVLLEREEKHPIIYYKIWEENTNQLLWEGWKFAKSN